MLLEPETLELAPAVDEALAAVAGDDRFASEPRRAQLEIVTPVCTTVGEACAELAGARATLVERLDGHLAVAAAGTHPFSTTLGEIAEGEDYRLIAAEY